MILLHYNPSVKITTGRVNGLPQNFVLTMSLPTYLPIISATVNYCFLFNVNFHFLGFEYNSRYVSKDRGISPKY